MPDLGVALQSTDQYQRGTPAPFTSPVAFAAVLPDSAAARSGIVRDDGLLSVDGQPIAKRQGLEAAPLNDSAFAMIADHPVGTPLRLGIAHGGERREVTLETKPECREHVVVLTDMGKISRSNEWGIQFSYGLVVRADDRQLAAMVAHELGHRILHHRERFTAAGVKKGLLGSIGRDRRLNLRGEAEADRMSVYLLANAGIDPKVAPELWRSKLGRELGAGHQSTSDRAKLMDAEIASHLTGAPPYYPTELMAHRNDPMK